MAPQSTKKKSKSKTPADAVLTDSLQLDPDAPPGELMAEASQALIAKYQDWSLKELEEAATEYREKLRVLAEEVEKADDLLAEAAEKDARELATGGLEVQSELPNYTAAQRKVAALIPKQWAAARIYQELDIARRLKGSEVIEEEISERAKEIPVAEAAYREAETHLQHLRQAQNDALAEKRDVLADFKGMVTNLARLTRGPDLRGMSKFLLQGPARSQPLRREEMVHIE